MINRNEDSVSEQRMHRCTDVPICLTGPLSVQPLAHAVFSSLPISGSTRHTLRALRTAMPSVALLCELRASSVPVSDSLDLNITVLLFKFATAAYKRT